MSDNEADIDGADEFFFESDHLALKENKDYRVLLKTIITLEVQRTQGIQDLDKIQELQKNALQDPIAFVETLNEGQSLGIPPPMKIQELPQIDWSKYQHVMPKEMNRPFTRTKKIVLERPSDSSNNADDSTSDDGKVLIRGRAFDDSKPETFNQLWTPEEQTRLEELLVEFPLEEVESRRWKKIADALGNRTAKQVQSRVQKYFKKLQLAGLPIPGRTPRMNLEMLKKSHRHQRNNHLLLKPSTFFPSLDPPVLMYDEMDDACSFNSNNEESQGPSEQQFCNNYEHQSNSISISANNHSELIKLIIKEKSQASQTGIHEGYSCDGCGDEPLRGTRWHCQDCGVQEVSYDLCSDCLASYVLSEAGTANSETPSVYCPSKHTVYHHFSPVRCPTKLSDTSAWDPDYLASTSSYNYLDPNFLPE